MNETRNLVIADMQIRSTVTSVGTRKIRIGKQ